MSDTHASARTAAGTDRHASAIGPRDHDRHGPRGKRKRYHAPVLTCFGDVRDVTLGGSPGIGDSGGSYVEKSF